jgi:hypothetical protein
MDSNDPRTVAETYFRAWKKRDFAGLRSILADDVGFQGPLATLDRRLTVTMSTVQPTATG